MKSVTMKKIGCEYLPCSFCKQDAVVKRKVTNSSGDKFKSYHRCLNCKKVTNVKLWEPLTGAGGMS